MTKYISRLGLPLLLASALTVGACARGGDGTDTALASDTMLNRDLQLAGQDTAARPALQDVPANTGTAPATRTPPRTSTPHQSTATGTASRPTTTPSGNTVTRGARGSEASLGTLPAGTSIGLSSTQRICTNTNKVGDRFTATVSEPVSAGGVTIPAGATAVVVVTALKGSANANDNVIVGLNVSSISYGGRTYSIQSEVQSASVNKVRTTTRGSDAKKVIGGAVIGAVAGQILGKDTKSTVTGAAAGAAAGTAAAIATGDYAGCINDGGRIVIRLTAPAQVRAE